MEKPDQRRRRPLDIEYVINQDIVAWVGQGRIADRTLENLRSSDIGISMMRQRFFAEIDAVAEGATRWASFAIRRRPGTWRCRI